MHAEVAGPAKTSAGFEPPRAAVVTARGSHSTQGLRAPPPSLQLLLLLVLSLLLSLLPSLPQLLFELDAADGGGPSPSRPWSPSPHAYSLPESVTANECAAPAATDTTRCPAWMDTKHRERAHVLSCLLRRKAVLGQ